MARINPLQNNCLLFFLLVLAEAAPGPGVLLAESPYTDSALVRVDVITEVQNPDDFLIIKENLLDEYKPEMFHQFDSTGVVLDDQDHIMTFLGYGRIYIDKKDTRFEIIAPEGERFQGDLVGVDQGNGAAVIKVTDKKLKKTPVCDSCNIKEGSTIVVPVAVGTGGMRFQSTQILSVNRRFMVQEKSDLILRTNRPFPGVGQPILNSDHYVLGFVVSQDPSNIRSVVYPISELIASARKIIENNGDIRTGWLGVKLVEFSSSAGRRVGIQYVVEDSPAKKAGLVASDILLAYNGNRIDSALGLIHLVQDTPVGEGAELQILRQGQPMTLTATIQAQKRQNPLKDYMVDLQDPFEPIRVTRKQPPPVGGEPPRPRIGFDTVVLTPQIADMKSLHGNSGLLVTNTVKQSPAYRAGIKNGDVIVSVNGMPVDDPGKVSSYLQSLEPGSVVSIRLLRGNSEQVVHVLLDK